MQSPVWDSMRNKRLGTHRSLEVEEGRRRPMLFEVQRMGRGECQG